MLQKILFVTMILTVKSRRKKKQHKDQHRLSCNICICLTQTVIYTSSVLNKSCYHVPQTVALLTLRAGPHYHKNLEHSEDPFLSKPWQPHSQHVAELEWLNCLSPCLDRGEELLLGGGQDEGSQQPEGWSRDLWRRRGRNTGRNWDSCNLRQWAREMECEEGEDKRLPFIFLWTITTSSFNLTDSFISPVPAYPTHMDLTSTLPPNLSLPLALRICFGS